MSKTTGSSAGKAKATSLHIGLNAVSADAYSGWSGELAACEFDANDMAGIATSCGMKPTVLLTKQGTRANVLSAIRAAARKTKAGDLFVLTYSGHGGQVPDVSGDEEDKQDETWCLYDGQLIDDELYLELSRFPTGARILIFSDSCHSGTVARAPMPQGDSDTSIGRPKMMPRTVGLRTYQEHQEFYDSLQRKIAKSAGQAAEADADSVLAHIAVSTRLTAIASKFSPAVILISGCQDNQTSMDGDRNGAFTEQLLHVWNGGAYRGTYATFYTDIKARMPRSQTPNFFPLGPAAQFVRQRPFSI